MLLSDDQHLQELPAVHEWGTNDHQNFLMLSTIFHLGFLGGGLFPFCGTGVWASEVRVLHGRVFFTDYIQNASACLGASVVRLENSPAITVCQTAYGFAEATREHCGVELPCCRFIVVGAASRACPLQ